MSVRLRNWVHDHGPRRKSDRHVLEILAADANTSGDSSHPGVRVIAEMVGLRERQVQYILRRLEAEGWIIPTAYATGGRSRCTRYSVWSPFNAIPDPVKRVQSEAPKGAVFRGSRLFLLYKTKETTTRASDEARESQASPITTTQKRPPDLIFEALADSCGIDWRHATASERGRLNRAAKEIREVGATPEEVLNRVANYKMHWPGATLSPQAITCNWSLIAKPPSNVLPFRSASVNHNADLITQIFQHAR